MERTVYKVGSFTDFAHKTREFVLCAVSSQVNSDSNKFLFLGIAVQNPKDSTPNTELAKTIARGKALKERSSIGFLQSSNPGFINTNVVNALLEQEANYFITNPGKYLKGYDKDKELFLKDQQAYFKKFGINV